LELKSDLDSESRLRLKTKPAPNVSHSQNGGVMLSKTLHDGLSDYAIGDKLRTLRLKKKMGLVELGKHTGLSPALLSKIERGLMFPTLPTLLRIALVFGVGLEFFFAGARDRPLVAVVRKGGRVRLPDRPGAREVAFRFESLDYPATERRFNCYYAEFFPVAPDRLRPHEHPGVEFIYAIQGTLSVHVGGEEHALQAGDSLYFDASIPHAYRRSGGRSCSAVVVTAQ
jgi:transcriptional regulator with XRE-family HTH domain